MPDNRSITDRLTEAGYSHRRVSGHGLYRHEVTRTDTGEVVGYYTAAEVCDDLLRIPLDEQALLVPRIAGFGAEE